MRSSLPPLAAALVGDAPEADAALEGRLRELVLAAHGAHPGVELDAERFVRHLGRHRPGQGTIDGWLGSICAADLYLACACAEGVPAAIAALDRRYRGQVGAYLSGMRPARSFVEDVTQAVLERLLVAVDGSPPRIAEYSGRGPLGSWLRVITLRLALDLRRRRTEALGDGEHEAEPAQGEDAWVDPELDLLKRRYGGDVNAALRAAVGALTPDQRILLRTHFVEGQTLEHLAAAHRVHRATVVRWIAAARQEILAGAKRQLGEKLSLRPAELESLMGVMRSQLDLTLSSALPEG
jgi:RNA polymerase sigma-70 factor (ECF subfamily)